MRGFDIVWLLALLAGVIAAMWVVHGGPDRLIDPGGVSIGVGELAALYGTLAVLCDLVLIARVPWLERRHGLDRLYAWHRWTGFAALSLLLTHAVATTIGFAEAGGLGAWRQTVEFVTAWPNVLASVVGLAMLIAVAVSSARAARRALTYEAWWFIHVYAYLAVALSFAHQFAVGSDFIQDWWARAFWVVIYSATAALIVGHRWVTPVVTAVRHRLRVVAIESEVPGVATIVIAGRNLDRLAAEAGQFFLLRFLVRDRWWKAMPLSLSAPPDGRTLRFTVKAVGDDSTAIQRLPLGTRVIAEGPYGVFGRAADSHRRVLLIAGGIGITPLRGLYEDLDRGAGDVTLLYRTRSKEQAVFLDDLRRISEERGFGLHVSYSRSAGRSADGGPISPKQLLSIAPDLADRDVFVCGPPSLISAATSSLRRLGVPSRRIHVERFAY